ncbi:MAG: glycosyltransferase family 4 protein [Clostridia bacterium]|nr:glycosyltransferase family 4 protein [Clostridia bacterium]
MKILMTLMGLDIGGAETHVVELSKELKTRGHEVIVVSNGGVYEEELTSSGIKCYHAPLHKRSISLMKEAYKRLDEIIATEKPDIVHAHARIPAFLCGKLKEKYDFRFVTTAHWVFKVNAILKKLTNWGEKCLAVSDDIKTYLIDNYGIDKNNIFVTVNGIDTNKFHPTNMGINICDEFGIDDRLPIVVYVSRLDEDRSLVAKQLIKASVDIRSKRKNVQFVIVGGGNDFDNVKALVDEANEKLGEKYIYLTGPRSDINNIVAIADVFVGVSRSALEAMSAGKLVILGGNEGYLGIFDESKLAKAKESNFCLRGCQMPNEELIRDDITRALDLSNQERSNIEAFGRDLILKDYSVKKMVDDYIRCYNSL